MSGIYNFHPNIATPGAFLNNQMASHQAPFYLGASQIPMGLELQEQVEQSRGMEGEGFKKTTHSLFRRRGNLIPSSQLRK